MAKTLSASVTAGALTAGAPADLEFGTTGGGVIRAQGDAVTIGRSGVYAVVGELVYTGDNDPQTVFATIVVEQPNGAVLPVDGDVAYSAAGANTRASQGAVGFYTAGTIFRLRVTLTGGSESVVSGSLKVTPLS